MQEALILQPVSPRKILLHRPSPLYSSIPYRVKEHSSDTMFTSLLTLLQEETRHPGTVDRILLCQQIRFLLPLKASDPREDAQKQAIIRWYTGTLDRWRRSLRGPRPLADVHPADRPRVRALLMN